MRTPLPGLDLAVPLIAAPMAGGASTTALVAAAAHAGGAGFVPGGYRTPDELAEQIAAVRAAGVPFGVNLFAPPPVPVDPDAFRRYADDLEPDAETLGLTLRGNTPVEDDDHWRAKLDLLLADPVPVVSFTFGIPERRTVTALRRAGTLTWQTVTDPTEALAAADAGVDALIVQAAAAGGHSGTLSPHRPLPELRLTDLLAAVRARTGLPTLAAGGIGTAADVAAAGRAGAAAVVVGTVLLRTRESGTSATYRAALAEGRRDTVLTRAFTGRPARGLRNDFIDRNTARAPLGYPAIHHLTAPVRRAAAAAGDPERLHLWAGTGYRHAREEPLAETFRRLYQGAGA
ncbi:nitroalkane oxidase [Krasilnikovia cinnamomea]|uniref:Propionate 3-nitronate monooxygenase n=1 Tax=Krasilnikovia cinnamomea TaxID=349313 RepID=A0A4Q7ZCL6_9ACTN|nr:nitronate monooxygenase [Krasilnikovia cinnamomea]RZU48378.1 nitroalkane oxidase [Krasilnikovia cinnamomea]